ncbi:hypothetical protein [Acinetobacter bereziniae]|uniref:HAD hydrolase-like protein n=1 Tax=Acinetobacter bereziniae TaxID=106648 RepID=UPI000574927A|nr:HAD hydrolase-like protein [Acinetobacter bereziniae]CEI53518.1 hypothetical protein [Acinetobacter bereziniae]
MIQAVLFDLDQTLLDRTSSLVQFLNWQLNTLTLVPLSQQQNFIQRFIALDANGAVWKDKVYAQLIQKLLILWGQNLSVCRPFYLTQNKK